MAAADDGGIERRRSVDERRADRGRQTADGDPYMRGELMRLAWCQFAKNATTIFIACTFSNVQWVFATRIGHAMR